MKILIVLYSLFLAGNLCLGSPLKTQISPYKSGDINGFLIDHIDEENLLYKMGLRQDDIIIKMNGAQLTSISTSKFLEALIDFEHSGITFDVLRDNQNVNVSYKLREYSFLESRHNRKNKRFDIVASPLSFKTYASYPYGLTLGYYLSHDQEIELDYNTGKMYWWGYKAQLKERSVVLRYKHYWGNSFYSHVGYGTRSINVEGSETEGISEKYSFKLNYQTKVIDVGIGNKWQWDNYTMGADWIGFLFPIGSNVSRSFTDQADEGDKEKVKSSFKELSDSHSVYYLRFYMGISF